MTQAFDASWATTWVCAQQLTESNNLPPEPGLTGNTLRQVLQISVGGSTLRIWFSNEFGAEPLVIAGASVAKSEGKGKIDVRHCHRLTFNGSRAVTVPPGERVSSDPAELPVAPLSNLAITLHCEACPRDVTGHPGSRTTSFVQSGAAYTQPSFETAVPVEHWYFLCRIDTWTRVHAPAVVTLGDSVTDGRGSTTDRNDRWPNHLARRLLQSNPTRPIAVLNQGIGGNRVLTDGIGPSALARFGRDVLDIPGVRWLVVFEGINDIGTAELASRYPQPTSTAEQLISAYEQMIARAHERAIRVYGGTLMPFEGAFYFNDERETHRTRVNEFIRSGVFDAVIDFDAIARDSHNPARLRPEIDGGDGLHPSAQGHQILGEAVDLSLFF